MDFCAHSTPEISLNTSFSGVLLLLSVDCDGFFVETCAGGSQQQQRFFTKHSQRGTKSSCSQKTDSERSSSNPSQQQKIVCLDHQPQLIFLSLHYYTDISQCQRRILKGKSYPLKEERSSPYLTFKNSRWISAVGRTLVDFQL